MDQEVGVKLLLGFLYAIQALDNDSRKLLKIHV